MPSVEIVEAATFTKLKRGRPKGALNKPKQEELEAIGSENK